MTRSKDQKSTQRGSRNKKMRRVLMLAVVLILALPVAACGGYGAPRSDFNVTSTEGAEFSLAEKRGEVVALYFMAGY